MARKSKLTAAEIEASENIDFNRAQGRKMGFTMMDIRDRGWGRLSNGIVIEWGIPRDRRQEGKLYGNIPPGHFVMHVNGKQVLFDADEFMKLLRWA